MELCDADCYADDTTVHTHTKTKIEVENKLQHDGNNSKSWTRQNKMIIHCDKTTCMLLGTRHFTQHTDHLNIYLDGNKIKSVKKPEIVRGSY